MARPSFRSLLAAGAVAFAAPVLAAEVPRLPDEALVISGVARYGRSPVPVDTIQARLAAGALVAPKDGEAVPGLDGKNRKWVRVAVKDGAVQNPALRGGYAFFRIECPADRVMLL
jgi:hypothetical protein